MAGIAAELPRRVRQPHGRRSSTRTPVLRRSSQSVESASHLMWRRPTLPQGSQASIAADVRAERTAHETRLPRWRTSAGPARPGRQPDRVRPAANIVLDRPGVLPQHCQLHVTSHGVMLDVPHGTTVSVNGRQVDGLIALRPGDSVAFDRSRHAWPRWRPRRGGAARGRRIRTPAGSANDDPGATAVRPVMPRYVLRGVSGEAFGQHLSDCTASPPIGRAPECDLRLDEPGMSRMHARLLPTDDGLLLEDLGSTNGCLHQRQARAARRSQRRRRNRVRHPALPPDRARQEGRRRSVVAKQVDRSPRVAAIAPVDRRPGYRWVPPIALAPLAASGRCR